MKKYMFGIFAIILAIGFSAFTAPKQSAEKATTTYWFLTTDAGIPINSATLETSNPTSCDDSDPDKFCVKEFSSYSGTGPYAPAGTELNAIKKTLVK